MAYVQTVEAVYEELAVHVEFASPFCPQLRAALLAAGRAHDGGTYLCMEGPQFSTRAESELHRSWGADLIGMTALPEAKLAREAGMCYATLACVTDYDTWQGEHESVSVELVVANLRRNVANARRIVADVARALPTRDCGCASALATAIITPADAWPEEMKRDLAPILDRLRASREKAVTP